MSVEVTRSGSLTGFLYWFSLHFPNGATISTAGPQHSGQVYRQYCSSGESLCQSIYPPTMTLGKL